ncbi:hypothetical protein L2E82_33161 [Cichorium intybus]|uniref:Uncharacterized protein n=1 Tax=Cichorium intybus TaxID=13427 RepID=A0ACB9BJE5_CICIN|nr:hypothetical protein L2E82_33161 [Cichorium intybus]
MEFVSIKAKEKFQKHKGVGSWFAVILPWTKTFQVEERVVWIDIEGVPSLAYSPRSFELIAKRWGELLYAEDSNDNNLYRKRLCIKTLNQQIIMESFKVIVQGKITVVRAREVIGWNPEYINEDEESDEEESEYSFDDKSISADELEKEEDILKSMEKDFGRRKKVPTGSNLEDGNEDIPWKHGEIKKGQNTLEGLENKVEQVKKDYMLEEGEMDPDDIVQQKSDDPFQIYELLKRKEVDVQETVEPECNYSVTPMYPPGYTPPTNEGDKSEGEKSVHMEKGPRFISGKNLDSISHVDGGKADSSHTTIRGGGTFEPHALAPGGCCGQNIEDFNIMGHIMGYKSNTITDEVFNHHGSKEFFQ